VRTETERERKEGFCRSRRLRDDSDDEQGLLARPGGDV